MTTFCTLDTVKGNLKVNSVFNIIRSIAMSNTNMFHFLFHFFETSTLFTMMSKRSPGGESAGGGPSTSKSTCVVAARILSSENAFVGFMQDGDRSNWPLTQQMFSFFEMLVESESSFAAYICHMKPAGLHCHQRLLLDVPSPPSPMLYSRTCLNSEFSCFCKCMCVTCLHVLLARTVHVHCEIMISQKQPEAVSLAWSITFSSIILTDLRGH